MAHISTLRQYWICSTSIMLKLRSLSVSHDVDSVTVLTNLLLAGNNLGKGEIDDCITGYPSIIKVGASQSPRPAPI